MSTISFKVSPNEARAIRTRAQKQRLTVSEFLRRQAVAPVHVLGEVKLKRCPLTGAMIFGHAEDLPPLTVDSTREMLTDFP